MTQRIALEGAVSDAPIIECVACADDNDGVPAPQLLADGWVLIAGNWTCTACVEEYRAEAQATYDMEWPAPVDVQAVER